MSLSIADWSSDIAFSSTSYRVVAWTTGHVYLQDGTTWDIDAGSTPNMNPDTTYYVYFDYDAYPTVLKWTTLPASSVGANKILIAVCRATAVPTPPDD